MLKRFAAVVLVSLLASASAVQAAISITACGTEIPPGETGILDADLDCSTVSGVCLECGESGCFEGMQVCLDEADCTGPDQAGCAHQPAIRLRKRATLDMNGHAIDGGPNCTAIFCDDIGGKFKIFSSVGRGEITGASCVGLAHRAKLDVQKIDVHGCGYGIYSGDVSARVHAVDVTANGNSVMGIRAASIDATNVTANDNGARGLSAESGKLTGNAITASNNGVIGAVSSKRFKLDGFVATGNGLLASEGSGSGIWGQQGGTLKSSTVTGNVFQDSGGPVALDILTGNKPKLIGSTCGRSGGNGGLLGDWDVCSGD